jgi:hypothetical protein
MKKILSRFKIQFGGSGAIGLVLLVPILACASPGKEFTKSINKEFEITRDGTVGVTNKYGDVDVRTWDGARVKFEVTIKVEARSQETANEVFNRITVSFDNHPSVVRALTEIESTSSWKKWFGWGSSDDFEIDYVVYVPASVALELDNKYGDVYVADKSGRTQINLKYGDMRLGQLTGKGAISLGYADGSIGSIGDVRLDLAYSDLKIGKAGNINLESQYSDVALETARDIKSATSFTDIKAGEVGHVANTGKYDDMVFEKAASVDVSSKYSSYDIGSLREYAKFEMSYGSANVRNVLQGFKAIDISATYTDVTINVDGTAHFLVDVYSKYCGIKHSGIEVSQNVERGSEHTIKGFRGSSSASSKITASMNYGELIIR